MCVRAYNDWLVEDWCGPSNGTARGRIIPLWDAGLAAEEIRRNAPRGLTSVCFSEIPVRLGLPSMYGGYWDPFFEACADTGTVINLHIGSSSGSSTPRPRMHRSVSGSATTSETALSRSRTG